MPYGSTTLLDRNDLNACFIILKMSSGNVQTVVVIVTTSLKRKVLYRSKEMFILLSEHSLIW